MAHKRRHVRVPIAGDAILSNRQGKYTHTRTIDISPGGICVMRPFDSLERADYQVEVSIEDGRRIQLMATLVCKGRQGVGFRTSSIDKQNVQVIADLVAEFQTTEEFIEQIDKYDLLAQYLIDEDGRKISISFDVN